ncbi:MAG TPA: hypothetical protein VFX92_08965 [Candidatus Krumholzibacteria bacterium]|nr:hypothetical protein [Candidatus Krumholzibacteria bacterium]
MNRVLAAVCLSAACLACSASHALTEVDVNSFSAIAKKYVVTAEIGTPGHADYRFIYADKSGHVHVYAAEKGGMEMVWEATTLGARATALAVADLYGDGVLKLVIATAAGRVLIYNMNTFELEWENLQQRYTKIDHMALAQLDGDRQLEAVFLADDKLWIFDSYNRNIQWNSTTAMLGNFVVVGNVDDDPQLEIILNTGLIVDSRFYNIQFQTDQVFGDRISLADLTGDGFPEVIGEFGDRTLRVFDVWRGREVW